MVEFSEAGIGPPGAGLELDKMEIPSVSDTSQVDDGGYRGVQVRSDPESSSNWSSKLKVILLVLGVLLPLALIFFLWDHGVVDLPYLGSKKVVRVIEKYATIGPVMTSVGKNQHVKLTVQIDCQNAKLKDKVSKFGSAIRSKLLIILSSPKAKEQLRRHEYSALKSKFKAEINRLMGKSYVKTVYIKNIVRY